MKATTFRRLAATALTLIAAALPASAQDKPTLRILVGFPPGAGTDTLARIYGDALRDALGATVIVENKPGAGGQLAAQALKTATADSNTLMFAVDHQVVMLPLIMKTPGFDVARDMQPVARIVNFYTCLAVPASSPARSYADYVESVRKSAAQGSFGIPAPGSQAQFLGFVIGYGDMADDIAMVHAVRDTVGPDAMLSIDANGFWNYEKALHIIRRLDPCGLDLIEQPLPHWDIEGMARLRAQVRTPIYADESAQELHHIKEIVDRRAADGLFIKLQKAGGILKSQRWLTLARLAGLPVHCGCMIGSGLEHSPAAHLWVSNEWASQGLNESIGPLMIHGAMESKDIATGTDIALNIPRFEAGVTAPNEGPGLGIELDEAFIVSHRTAGKQPRTVRL